MKTKLIQIYSDDGYQFFALYHDEIEEWLPIPDEDIDALIANLQSRTPDERHHDRAEFLGFTWYTTDEAVAHAKERGFDIARRTVQKAAKNGKFKAEKHKKDWKIEAMRFRGWLVENFQPQKRNGLAK